MKNVTITLDEETLTWVRVEAAKRGTSVSRLVGEMLSSHREQENAYDAARQSYLTRGSFPLTGQPQQYPTRESLYDREIFRR